MLEILPVVLQTEICHAWARAGDPLPIGYAL
jgi:hypothetical protein